MEPDKLKKLLKRIAIVGSFFLLGLLLYLLGGSNYALARWLLLSYALLVTAVMVLAILLQSGRGGGLASLGGLGGDALLGTRSATPIAKATYVMGALFLFICMLMARLGGEAPAAREGELPAGERPAVEQPLGVGAPEGAEETGEEMPPPSEPSGGREEE